MAAQADKAKKRAYDHAYRLANLEKRRAQWKAWVAANRERRKASRRALYLANKDEAIAYARTYQLANIEQRRAYLRGYYIAHQDNIRAQSRAWAIANKEAVRIRSQSRRARTLQASGTATASAIRARVAFYGWKCWMCRGPYQAVDHVKPLTKGGSNWPANLRPICKSCNSRKAASWPI